MRAPDPHPIPRFKHCMDPGSPVFALDPPWIPSGSPTDPHWSHCSHGARICRNSGLLLTSDDDAAYHMIARLLMHTVSDVTKELFGASSRPNFALVH